jgi:hypothetical protein
MVARGFCGQSLSKKQVYDWVAGAAGQRPSVCISPVANARHEHVIILFIQGVDDPVVPDSNPVVVELVPEEVAFQFSAARRDRVFHQIVDGIEDPILSLVGELLDLLLSPAGEVDFMHAELRILYIMYILCNQGFRRRRPSRSACLLNEGDWPAEA